ncbi:MAG: TolB family protein, partial [Bryobacteraceae bacterium]
MKSAVFLAVGAFASLASAAPAPNTLKTLSSISSDAAAPSRSFVLAVGGRSWFYNPSRNIWKAPFLENVYKSFGISSDGRHFLYLKSYGHLPGFSLHLYDLYEGVETLVTPDRVFHASFAPDGARFAYVKLHSVADFELFVQSVAAGPPRRIAGGLLAPGYLEWSQDSGRLAWRSMIPLTEDFREDGKVH